MACSLSQLVFSLKRYLYTTYSTPIVAPWIRLVNSLRVFRPSRSFLAIPTKKDGGNHTSAFTDSAETIEAHNACLDVTKALAATGIRVVLDDEFFAQVVEGL